MVLPIDIFSWKTQLFFAVRNSHSDTHKNAWTIDPATSFVKKIIKIIYIRIGSVKNGQVLLPAMRKIGCGFNLYNFEQSCSSGETQKKIAVNVAKAAN